MTELAGASIRAKQSIKAQRGFTILELVVAMATAAILMIGCISSYVMLTEAQGKNKQMTKQHRKLRGPLALAALDYQAAGRAGLQPRNAGMYGVTDIRRRALDGTIDPNGFPAVIYDTLKEDRDGNGRLDDDDNPPHTITWRLIDFDLDGGVVPDLVQIDDDNNGNVCNGGVPLTTLIAKDVQNIGFAFATDNNRDGLLDTNNVDRSIDNTIFPAGDIAAVTQWCVDTDGDNVLDAHLDATMGGLINENDDGDQDGSIDTVPIAPIPLARIRQVRMYILVQSPDRDPGYVDRNAYVFGQNVLHPFPIGDPQRRFEFHRQVLSIGVSIRNREPDLAL